jgi:uncharacterized protein (TIGR03084 family)
MDTSMGAIVADLAEQQAELAALLAPLDDEDWERPSRCDGWMVADVVLHLAQTNEMAVASLEGTFTGFGGPVPEGGVPAAGDIDNAADVGVEAERGQPVEALRARWQASVEAFDRLLRADDPHRRVRWVTGQLSVQTLAATRLAEAWIHTGDVAAAFDITPAPGERLRHVARLAWRTLPYAFAQAGLELAGPVAFELRGPTGAPWDFRPDGEVATVVRGEGSELCLVAARRRHRAADGGARRRRGAPPGPHLRLTCCPRSRRHAALSAGGIRRPGSRRRPAAGPPGPAASG